MKTIRRTKMIAIGFITMFIVGFTQPSFSYYKTENPVEFKMIGNVNHAPLFQLKAANVEGNEYLLKVKDANGILLYSEVLKGKNISRKYQLDLGESVTDEDALNIRFEVVNLKSHETMVYNIVRNRRMVEDIVVAKL
jgi:hypothetical protein